MKNETGTTSNRLYVCGRCGDSSDNLHEAKIHAKMHTGVRFEVLYPGATATESLEALEAPATKGA